MAKEYFVQLLNGNTSNITTTRANSPSEVMDKLVGKDNYEKCERFQANVIIKARTSDRMNYYTIKQHNIVNPNNIYQEMIMLTYSLSQLYYGRKIYNNITEEQAVRMLNGIIKRIVMNKRDKETFNSIVEYIKTSKNGNEILKYISIDKIEKEIDVRLNFDKALSEVEYGSDLSLILDFGFSDKDIIELAKLHKANKYRDKIECLLEDCNFHTVSKSLREGNYKRYLDKVEVGYNE